MEVIPAAYSVADYCQQMARKEIQINQEYQRSDRVWPPTARSFLIETMLLGYPIPKLSLYQVTDIKSRTSIKEIVDGQQRSKAIFDYFNDGFRLSRSLELEEIRGKRFSDLDEEYQLRFLDYSIPTNLFVAATSKEIREMFRRINSYTVPLNPEEQRHAIFQGHFKWFIYRLSNRYESTFLNMGVFTEKQIIRMADTKLLTEVCHALVNGIKTTNKKSLDELYRRFDKEFPAESWLEEHIEKAMTRLISLGEIHNGPLMRPYVMYSLILAVAHRESPVETLANVYQSDLPYKFERDVVVANLSRLAEALEDPEETLEGLVLEGLEGAESKLKEFVRASSEQTNVASQRETRFRLLCEALEPYLL